VLEILAHRGEAGVSEVAADIGVHKSTAFRLLGALEDRELVEQTQERGKDRLGFGSTPRPAALLAYMTPEHRREVLHTSGFTRLTRRTITSPGELNAQFEKAIRDGYACSVEELEDGLNAIAAPIRDHTGEVLAALSVSGPV
jgi:DNA-binding IclR family transcriptional regulator